MHERPIEFATVPFSVEIKQAGVRFIPTDDRAHVADLVRTYHNRASALAQDVGIDVPEYMRFDEVRHITDVDERLRMGSGRMAPLFAVGFLPYSSFSGVPNGEPAWLLNVLAAYGRRNAPDWATVLSSPTPEELEWAQGITTCVCGEPSDNPGLMELAIDAHARLQVALTRYAEQVVDSEQNPLVPLRRLHDYGEFYLGINRHFEKSVARVFP